MLDLKIVERRKVYTSDKREYIGYVVGKDKISYLVEVDNPNMRGWEGSQVNIQSYGLDPNKKYWFFAKDGLSATTVYNVD